MNLRKTINRIIAPRIKTHIFIDPETFQPRRGILTRYGRKLLEEGAKYYKTIDLKDIQNGNF